MNKYHKIQTVFNRDPANNYKTLLHGEFATPEFRYLADLQWEFTEKIDGTNIRVIFHHLEEDVYFFSFKGKTDNAQIPPFLLKTLMEQFILLEDEFAKRFPDGICLYGEGYGAKIQKGGGNYRSDVGFILFDIKIGDWWLKREDIQQIADDFAIDIVPTIGHGTLWDMVKMVEKGYRSWIAEQTINAEGIVARPIVELFARNGERIITKIKEKDFR